MSDVFDEGEEQRQPPAAEPRRSRALIITAAILVVGFFALTTFASFWTNRAWYESTGFSDVFSTLLWTRVGLFFVFGGLMGLIVGVNMYLAYRFRPLFRHAVARAVGPRPLPRGRHPDPDVADDRRRGPARPLRRYVGLGPVAPVHAVAQRRSVRQRGRLLRARHRLLRLRPAVAPLPGRLRDGVLRRRAADGRARPLPLRRHPAPDARRPALRRRPGAALGAARRVRARQGCRLLAGPVRPGQRQGCADHRHDLHRRERRAAGQEHPDGHRPDLRRAVLPQRVAPHLDAAVGRAGAARAERRAARHDLAGRRPAVPGQAERARPGGAVHRGATSTPPGPRTTWRTSRSSRSRARAQPISAS